MPHVLSFSRPLEVHQLRAWYTMMIEYHPDEYSAEAGHYSNREDH